MNAAFWCLFIVDILIAALLLVGKNFRESFGASAINTWFTVLLFAGTIAAGVFKYLGRGKLALACACLPVLVMYGWYLLDKRAGR